VNVKEIDRTGETGNHSGRYGGRIRLCVIHTTEGNWGQTPEQLHQWMKNNGVSYHYIFGGGQCLAIVDTDRAAWAALDANGYTINLVFSGSQASLSRELWIQRFRDDIRNAAEIIVRDAKKYGFNARMIDWDQIGRGEAGTTDHYGITMGLGIGNHTDVGKAFPFDLLQADIESFLVGVPAPVVVPAPNAIAAKRAEVGFGWLGNKITVGIEGSCPDGRGKFVEYENGHIYWTATTGAIAVPKNIVEDWGRRGYERSPLGYPINNHTVLVDAERNNTPVGDVQAFENGALYRKYGLDGVWVHGAILAHYRRSGFENGPLGWPTSEEQPVGDGRVQHFENGSVAWSPEGTTALRTADGPDEILPDHTH
jgi:hypothetical protein